MGLVLGIDSQIPPQLKFVPKEEKFGEYRLEDGTIIEARVFLADIIKIGEDPVGPRIAYSTVAAIRFLVPEELRRKVLSKPVVDHVEPRDKGWVPVKIVDAKPAISKYIIDDKWLLVLRLEIIGVAKNENYRTPLLMPHYSARWTAVARIERLQEKNKEIP